MIKSQLIAQIAAQMTDLSENKITDGINQIVEIMSDALVNNQRIEIRGFGSFSLHYRASRNAHNPKNGEKVVTKPKYTPYFKPGKQLRDRVNESRHSVPLKN